MRIHHGRRGRPSDCRRRRWRVRPSTTSLALIGAALALATGTAVAADVSTPVVCGSNGCMSLPTSTLHGLLTLPEALRPADPPPAQPFLLLRVADPDGATHRSSTSRATLGRSWGSRARRGGVSSRPTMRSCSSTQRRARRPTPHLPPTRRSACCSPPKIDPAGATVRGRCSRRCSASECWESRRTRRSPRFPVDSAKRGEVRSVR